MSFGYPSLHEPNSLALKHYAYVCDWLKILGSGEISNSAGVRGRGGAKAQGVKFWSLLGRWCIP